MTIEIHQPELEALIVDGMRSGQNAEAVLMQALRLRVATPIASERLDWRSMRGMARGEDSLTQALIEERAFEKAHDETRHQGS